MSQSRTSLSLNVQDFYISVNSNHPIFLILYNACLWFMISGEATIKPVAQQRFLLINILSIILKGMIPMSIPYTPPEAKTKYKIT